MMYIIMTVFRFRSGRPPAAHRGKRLPTTTKCREMRLKLSIRHQRDIPLSDDLFTLAQSLLSHLQGIIICWHSLAALMILDRAAASKIARTRGHGTRSTAALWALQVESTSVNFSEFVAGKVITWVCASLVSYPLIRADRRSGLSANKHPFAKSLMLLAATVTTLKAFKVCTKGNLLRKQVKLSCIKIWGHLLSDETCITPGRVIAPCLICCCMT